jgi:hypothetical protein
METDVLVVALMEHRRLTGRLLDDLAGLCASDSAVGILPALTEHLRASDLQLREVVDELANRTRSAS